MLNGRRFVIWGLSRLSVRVAKALAAGRATVTVMRLRGEADTLRPLLGPDIQTLEALTEEAGETLRAAGLAGANCLLALSESDLENLRAAVAARETAPEVPVVLRAFDPLLADQMEQGWNVRRAYSVSALAAPAFVAAACGDRVLETLRLGDGEVPICHLTIRPGSPLAGKSASEVKARFGCAVLARSENGVIWQPVPSGAAGEMLRERRTNPSRRAARTRAAGGDAQRGLAQRRGEPESGAGRSRSRGGVRRCSRKSPPR